MKSSSARVQLLALAAFLLSAALGFAQPNLRILLPERTRLLQDQRLDLVIEARNVTNADALRVTANGQDITGRFVGPIAADLDCDGAPDSIYRADLISFPEAGNIRIEASANAGGTRIATFKDIHVRPFTPADKPRSVILYIGDAMGTAYRDAARIVGRSVESRPGLSGLREGFFDDLLEMDKMPVSGMVMTYASDRVIPDSANTATAWATGNKTFEGALNVFADGTDCLWRAGVNASNIAAALDNPRIETLWEYLKRKYNYRTGIVTTAYVTDATPAGEGAHTAVRATRFEIARQYLESPILAGQPAFDVIMGGGKDEFDPDIRADGRDLVAEFQQRGFTFVSTAADLRAVSPGTQKLLGLFRRSNEAARHSTGVRSTVDGNMDVAYDKLGLVRPASEPQPNFGRWTDQPMLDLMTLKAIEVLGGPGGGRPFILMVEGASIDKQSHPNHAVGVIWDTLELDKAVGVGRAFAKARRPADTLLLVTADHDQSMSIIGVNQISDADLTDRGTSWEMVIQPRVGEQRAKLFKDANFNVRAAYGYAGSGGDPNTAGPEGAPAMDFQRIYADGFPNYVDPNGAGYPTNTRVGDKGTIRLSVGFRTGNHTGSSVPITAEGPGAFLFTSYMDQTDIAFKIAVSLSGDTAEGDAFVERVLLNPKYPFTYGKCQGLCLY